MRPLRAEPLTGRQCPLLASGRDARAIRDDDRPRAQQPWKGGHLMVAVSGPAQLRAELPGEHELVAPELLQK